MIRIKTAGEIAKMRAAGRIVAEALDIVERLVAPGISTKALEQAARAHIEKRGAKPSFLGYRGFPAAITVSVNDEIIHGIPGKRRLAEGDIVSVDIGAVKDGYHGDAARTFGVGEIDPAAKKLIDVTRECFYVGMSFARAGGRLFDVSGAVEQHAVASGFSVVREYIGHGVGAQLHEPPDVPNYKGKGRGVRLVPGMTFALEPMVNAGRGDIHINDDGWTVETADGSLSAHYENTILVTDGEPELLTVI